MSRITYVNGEYVPHEKAYIHVEDRAFQFSDGVYEVMAIYKGFFVYGESHFDRLGRSLRELRIEWPMSREAPKEALRELIHRNKMESGTVYIEITRGVAPRDHAFPPASVPRTLVMTVKPFEFPQPEDVAYATCKVITVPDIRWGRCDIKSVNRLPNCIALQKAREADAYEAVLYDRDGMVTECSGANAWMVSEAGVLMTRPLGNAILGGTVRAHTFALAERSDVPVVERAFSLEEFKGAREVFLTSTTPMVKSIGQVDNTVIGDGTMGPVTRKLLDAHRSQVFAMTDDT